MAVARLVQPGDAPAVRPGQPRTAGHRGIPSARSGRAVTVCVGNGPRDVTKYRSTEKGLFDSLAVTGTARVHLLAEAQTHFFTPRRRMVWTFPASQRTLPRDRSSIVTSDSGPGRTSVNVESARKRIHRCRGLAMPERKAGLITGKPIAGKHRRSRQVGQGPSTALLAPPPRAPRSTEVPRPGRRRPRPGGPLPQGALRQARPQGCPGPA